MLTRMDYLRLRSQFVTELLDMPSVPKHIRAKFKEELLEKLDKGYAEYKDASYSRPGKELLGEMQEEALDIPGWLSIEYAKMVKAGESEYNTGLIVNLAQMGLIAYHRAELMKGMIEDADHREEQKEVYTAKTLT